MKKPDTSALVAYAQNKANAKARGIGFKLTFAEWWSLWEKYFHLRGQHNGNYVLCRVGDKGDYEVGNVYVGTVERNGRTRGEDSVKRRFESVEREEYLTYDCREDDEEGWLPKELKESTNSIIAKIGMV